MQPEPVSRRSRRRPLGVTILVVMELLLAALLAIGLVTDGSVTLPLISTEDEPGVATAATVIALVLAGGLWFLRRWAWIGVMLWHGIILGTSLLAYIRGETPYAEMAISMIIVFYLNQSDVEGAFRRRSVTEHSEPAI